MTIFRKLLKTLKTMVERRSQARAERRMFRSIVARRDNHLLRDIGLTRHDAETIDPFRLRKGSGRHQDEHDQGD